MFKVMIQVKARTIFDDPITGEYDGIHYSTKEEAQKVRRQFQRDRQQQP